MRSTTEEAKKDLYPFVVVPGGRYMLRETDSRHTGYPFPRHIQRRYTRTEVERILSHMDRTAASLTEAISEVAGRPEPQ